MSLRRHRIRADCGPGPTPAKTTEPLDRDGAGSASISSYLSSMGTSSICRSFFAASLIISLLIPYPSVLIESSLTAAGERARNPLCESENVFRRIPRWRSQGFSAQNDDTEGFQYNLSRCIGSLSRCHTHLLKPVWR